MHRLRTRKKTKGATDDDIPPVPILSSKTFFSKSKATPPPKEPEIDLDSVLPSSDDFRTSLLMPNLANRFSILKMQEAAAAAAAAGTPSQYDALNLEIGVGISDPDYNPKRFIGLGDIAETDSITGSMTSRFTSVSEDAGRDSEDGTVMNRPRGGEGNVLFGGRQKVYRVPASSALRGGTTSMEDLRGGGGSLGARAVYDHDLPDTRSKHNRDSEHDSEGNGDQTEFNKNRFTTSSTNSTPASMTRSSTAATSINSQTGHSGTQASNSTPQSPTISSKPRRPLYEQALDQQLQDQQTTALSRLERLASLRKLGAASPPPGSESPVSGSASVLVSPVSPSTKQTMPWSSKRASPHSPLSPSAEDYQERTSTTTEEPVKPSGIEKFDFGLGSGSLSPISPPLSSKSNEFPTRGPFSPGALTVDRGNKWDRPGVSRSGSAVSLGAVGEGSRKSQNSDNMLDAPKSQAEEVRSTFLSTSTASDESSLNQDLVIQQLEEQLDHTKHDSLHTLSPRMGVPGLSTHVVSEPTSPTSARSSVSAMSDIPPKSLLEAEKPFRNPSVSPQSPQFAADIHSPDDDSPTLPPGQGLSLLVRQHLRSDSGGSSMYAGSTYNRFSRLSRAGMGSVPPIPTGDHKLTIESRASGSSAGNIWQYDEFEVASPREVLMEEKEEKEVPSSPTSIYPPTIAPPQTPPEIPQRSIERTESRGRPSEDSGERGRDRSIGRPSEETMASRAGDNDMDWEQQLAFRRQLIQQNLRNQEKINSQHDMPFPESPGGHPALQKPTGNGGAFGALRSKSSNGILKGEAKIPKIMGMDNGSAPQLPRPDSRNRSRYDGGRAFEEEQSRMRQGRGPNIGGPPGHPMQGPPGHPLHGPGPRPQQRPARPSLNTNQPGPPPERGALSPTGQPHPKKSPMLTPRMRQQASREKLSASSAENTPRGQPMGWQESWDTPRSPYVPPTPRSNPGTPNLSKPTSRGKPGNSPADAYKDDLSRAMMTGQSQMAVQRNRGKSSPKEPIENFKSTFEAEEPERPLGSFRRQRANSTTGPPAARQKSIIDPPQRPAAPPIPITIDTGASSSSDSIPTVSRAGSSATSAKAQDAELIQTIQQTNAQFAPAKKRSVNKHLISEPKLLSKTSHIPTRNISKDLSPPPPAVPAAAPLNKTQRRTRTNTIFGALSRNRSSDEPMPDTVAATRSDDEAVEEKPRKNRLRKSTSDGGTLGQRARAQDVAAMQDAMPKFQKSMVGVPIHGDGRMI